MAAIETVRSVLRFQGHLTGGLCCAWSPDGQYIATGGRDHLACLWDASSGELIAKFKGHTGAVTSLSWFPDGESIATGSLDQSVQLWKACHAPLTIRQLRVPTFHVTDVAWSPPAGLLLAASTEEGALHIWGP